MSAREAPRRATPRFFSKVWNRRYTTAPEQKSKPFRFPGMIHQLGYSLSGNLTTLLDSHFLRVYYLLYLNALLTKVLAKLFVEPFSKKVSKKIRY